MEPTGDLNTELKDESPFDIPWKELMAKYRFAYCDSYLPPHSYTYRHDTLNHTKLNDHFIVSQTLINQGLICDHLILDEGANTSDHLPLQMKLSLNIQIQNPTVSSASSRGKLDWKKLSQLTRTITLLF